MTAPKRQKKTSKRDRGAKADKQANRPSPTTYVDQDEPHAVVRQAAKAGLIHLGASFELTPDASTATAPYDLNDLLRTHGAKEAAYEALGCEMATVPEGVRFRAQQLLPMVDFVAGSDAAPAQMIGQVKRLVDLWIAGDATGVEAWMMVLRGIMACEQICEHAWRLELRKAVQAVKRAERAAARPKGPRTNPHARERRVHEAKQAHRAARQDAIKQATKRICDILRSLGNSTTDAPPRMVNVTDEQIAQAAAKWVDGKPVSVTRRRRSHVEPWAAARNFAALFGVAMPTRESDTTRSRKTGRSAR